MATRLGTVRTADFMDIFLSAENRYPNPLSLPNIEGLRLPNLMSFRGGVWGNFNAGIVDKPQWVTMGQDKICYNDANSDSTKVRTMQVQVCLFKSYAEVCPADFYNIVCGSQTGIALQDMLNANLPTAAQGAVINNPMAAMTAIAIDNHRKQATDDFVKHTIFGASVWSNRTTTPAGTGGTRGFLLKLSSPTTVTEEYETNFINKTLGKCDGLWGQLMAGALETDPRLKVNRVFSNDGTVAGNALNPLYTLSYIQSMINSIQLPYKNQPENCAIFIDPAIFRSLQVAIENKFTGTSEGVSLFRAGEFQFAMVRGYMVVPFKASELLDMDNDAMITTTIPTMGAVTHSANLRGMVLVADNIIMGMDASVQATGDRDMVLVARPDYSDNRKEGNFVIKGGYFSGLGIIEPRYCTVSYSNSNTYAV